ncbi:MAG: allR [Firmicutes bacterium]|nr:allR [Bacillota bacterium]
MTNTKKTNVKSASRVLDVIEYIVNCSKPPTFRMIREALDIPKSSMSYLLQDLITRDYINSDADLKVYYPGLKLIQLGAASINNTDISREISFATKKLSEDLKVTAHAAILDDRFVVYIAKAQSSTDLSLVTNIGFRIPAHATAVGKVLLAALAPSELEMRLKNVELERYTENTVTSFEKLQEDLLTIDKNGYAIDNQEVIPGGICIAAPIYDKTNRVIAAISATMPLTRSTDEFLAEVIKIVCSMANYVSIRLGKI